MLMLYNVLQGRPSDQRKAEIWPPEVEAPHITVTGHAGGFSKAVSGQAKRAGGPSLVFWPTLPFSSPPLLAGPELLVVVAEFEQILWQLSIRATDTFDQ